MVSARRFGGFGLAILCPILVLFIPQALATKVPRAWPPAALVLGTERISAAV